LIKERKYTNSHLEIGKKQAKSK